MNPGLAAMRYRCGKDYGHNEISPAGRNNTMMDARHAVNHYN